MPDEELRTRPLVAVAVSPLSGECRHVGHGSAGGRVLDCRQVEDRLVKGGHLVATGFGVDELAQGNAQFERRILVILGRIHKLGINLGLLVDGRERVQRKIRPQQALFKRLDIEAGDDAKVVAPAAERQPQVRDLLLAGLNNGAVGENNLERNDLPIGDAAAGSHARPVAADDDRVEAAHVDSDSGATGRASEPLVPAAPYGKLASGGSHGLDHSGYIAGRPGRDEALGMEARDLRAKIRRKRCGVCVASRKQDLVGTEGGLQGCTGLFHCEKKPSAQKPRERETGAKGKKGVK
ncbi:hypothetical protein E5D57_009771 [Metarhizium anisopliae]|nr:hypothetical protein E5D57_009771 [Metarhizium anisopliae]